MITAIDGDMLCRRWEAIKHIDVALQRLLEHLYKLRRFPEPFSPPDKMCVCLTDGTWRRPPYRPRHTQEAVRASIVRACEGFDIPVIVVGGFESVDLMATIAHQEPSILVSDDLRLACVMSDTCEMYRPSESKYGAGWELWSHAEWSRQYGPKACKNWAGFLRLVGLDTHQMKRLCGPHSAVRDCDTVGSDRHWMELAVLDTEIDVPEVSPAAKGWILQADIEEIANVLKSHEQKLYEKTLAQLRHELDPSEPTDYPQGSIERQVVYALRGEKGLPLHIEGDVNVRRGTEHGDVQDNK